MEKKSTNYGNEYLINVLILMYEPPLHAADSDAGRTATLATLDNTFGAWDASVCWFHKDIAKLFRLADAAGNAAFAPLAPF